jgi:hypothetical protein
MHNFQSEYKEAREAFGEFQGYSTEMLRQCSEGSYFLSIKTSFRLAEEQYKKINQICNDLSLWHGAKVEGKSLSEWTLKEREQNILVRSLERATSGTMNALLGVYGFWLAKAQFTED